MLKEICVIQFGGTILIYIHVKAQTSDLLQNIELKCHYLNLKNWIEKSVRSQRKTWGRQFVTMAGMLSAFQSNSAQFLI